MITAMQGWLRGKDARNANNSPLFLTILSYYDPVHGGSKSLYNGNISEMMWRQGANQLQSYTYSYDGMSRLTDTHHLSNLAIVDQNVEQNIRYDFNSNICSMTRINDGVNEYISADYYGNQDINNNYDKRGNIVAINAKEVFMDYNLLNLPSQIKHYYEPEGSTTDYVYLTDGRKLTANFNGGEGLEYLGSFVYLRNAQGGLSLESTDFAAGRIENSTTGYKVNYHLTDHLSSVRAIATSTGAGTPPTITSRMDYHPFGTPHASSPLPTSTQKHRYTFCGKEEQRIAPIIPAQFKVAVMDQGARYYIPNTMQFTSQDPLAIKYPHISPYVYCLNNPILYVDPTGMHPVYDSDGNFLGTDDTGLQGHSIVMLPKNFKQGMRYEDAMSFKTTTNNVNTNERIKSHRENLSTRPDWDGYLTLEEANEWHRVGNGEPLFVGLDKIDLSGIVSLGEKYVGQIKTFNLLLVSHSVNDGLVYGQITLKRYPNHTVRAFADKYDFEMHSWNNPLNWVRNVEAVIGGVVAGQGTGYKINIFGSKKLKPIVPCIK